jgi:hypothetical protein
MFVLVSCSSGERRMLGSTRLEYRRIESLPPLLNKMSENNRRFRGFKDDKRESRPCVGSFSHCKVQFSY